MVFQDVRAANGSGSARLAGRIFVLANGEIVEDGTHDELLAQRRFYADMWESQAEWYRREGAS